MEAVTGFVGRDLELEQAVSALQSGASIVVKGRAGIGKSAFLRQVYQATLYRKTLHLGAGQEPQGDDL